MTTVPWGSFGVTMETARGFGVANPRGVAPAVPGAEPIRLWRAIGWVAFGLGLAEALKHIAGPAPVY